MTLKLLQTVRAWAVPALAALAALTAPTASAQDYVRLMGVMLDICQPKGVLTDSYTSQDGKSTAALNNETGSLRVTVVAPGWHSAQWLRTPASDTPGNKDFVFTNRWTGETLTAYVGEDGKPVVAALKPDATIPNFQPERGSRRQPGAAEQIWQVNSLNGNWVSLTQPGIHVDRSGIKWHLKVKDGCIPDIQVGGEPESASTWQVEVSEAAAPPPPENGYVWIQKTGTLKAINVETSTPTASTVEPGWHSAQWEMQSLANRASELRTLPPGEPVIFINRWTGQALAHEITPAAGGKPIEVRLVTVPPPTFTSQGKLSSLAGVWVLSVKPAADGSVEILSPTGTKLGLNADGKTFNGPYPGWTIASHHPGYVPPAPVEEYVRLISTDGRAINNQTGAPQAGAFEPGWWSAQWVAQRVAGPYDGEFVTYRNRWTNQYLGVANGALAMVDAVANLNNPAQVNYIWQVTGGTPDASKKALRHLMSGKYLGTAPSGASLYDGAPSFVWTVNDVQ